MWLTCQIVQMQAGYRAGFTGYRVNDDGELATGK
jgi:hypothetical protein